MKDNFKNQNETKPEEDLKINCPYLSCYGKALKISTKNISGLIGAEAYFNGMLDGRGYVFLNEVYEFLGLEKTEAGDKVGWIKDNPEGDERIIFEIHQTDRMYIDFNVDGVIIDKIKKEKLD